MVPIELIPTLPSIHQGVLHELYSLRTGCTGHDIGDYDRAYHGGYQEFSCLLLQHSRS